MIRNDPSDPAVAVPRESLPLNSSTILSASAVPSIVGVVILVNAVVVVITGASGAVVSIVIGVLLMGQRYCLPHLLQSLSMCNQHL